MKINFYDKQGNILINKIDEAYASMRKAKKKYSPELAAAQRAFSDYCQSKTSKGGAQ